MIYRPICWFKTFWRTAGYFIRTGQAWACVDGHDWVEQEDRTLKCETCGKHDPTKTTY